MPGTVTRRASEGWAKRCFNFLAYQHDVSYGSQRGIATTFVG
jgi:hypothetical protein